MGIWGVELGDSVLGLSRLIVDLIEGEDEGLDGHGHGSDPIRKHCDKLLIRVVHVLDACRLAVDHEAPVVHRMLDRLKHVGIDPAA
jgi:hypothetical protein